jgi:hypothetical protein
VAECTHLPLDLAPLRATFPGGATLVARDLVMAAQPALAPLQPIFDIIDAISATLRVVQAIPDALGPPPDPTGIISLLPELAEKVGKLAGLVPQLSVPIMTVNMIDGVIRELEQAQSQLRSLADLVARAAAAEQRAQELRDEGLAKLAGCAREDAATSSGNLLRGLGAVAGVLGMLRPLVLAVGGPQLPDLSSLDGDDLGQLNAAFEELITLLRTLRGAIPIP